MTSGPSSSTDQALESLKVLPLEADLELARRSLPGAMSYSILLIIVAISTPYSVDHPLVIEITAAAQIFVGVARILVAQAMLRNYRGGVARWSGLFRVGAYSSALIWGVFAAFTVVQYGGQWTAM